jgi:hypothetical protein
MIRSAASSRSCSSCGPVWPYHRARSGAPAFTFMFDNAIGGPHVLAVSAARTIFSTRSSWSIQSIEFNPPADRPDRHRVPGRKQLVRHGNAHGFTCHSHHGSRKPQPACGKAECRSDRWPSDISPPDGYSRSGGEARLKERRRVMVEVAFERARELASRATAYLLERKRVGA